MVTDGSGLNGLTNLIIDARKGEGWGGGEKALLFNWLNIRYKEVKNPE